MIALYNSLFGLALALVSFTLAPALFGKVRRRGPWIAQMISWLVYSASYILLAGHQLGPKPPLGICVFQATLVYAVAPLYVIKDSYVLIEARHFDILDARLRRHVMSSMLGALFATSFLELTCRLPAV